MPVNFETPDPGIIDRPYVEQIPLEALFKNLSYKQSKYDQGLQDAKHQLDMVNNIPAFGQDVAVKNQMFQKLNQELSKFSGANLGDTSVSSQLDGLISNFNSSNDITNIYARGSALKKMESEEEAARLKSDEYYNPGLDALRKYYASGVYSSSVKFQDTPGIAPKIADILTTIRENTSWNEKNVVDPATGETYVKKWQDPEDLKKTRDVVLANMPSYRQHQEYSLNKQYDLQPDEWHQVAANHFSPIIEAEQHNLKLIQGILNNPKTSAEDKTKYTQAQKNSLANITRYQGLVGNNAATEAIKSELFRQERDNQDNGLIEGMDAVQETPMKLTEAKHLQIELSNKLAEIQATKVADAKEAAGLLTDPATGEYIPAKITNAKGDVVNPQIVLNELDEIEKNPEAHGIAGQNQGNSVRLLKEIPAIFNTSVFDKGVGTTTSKTVNDDTGEVTYKTEKASIHPKEVSYNPATKKFRLLYPGGVAEYITAAEVKTRIGIDKPSLAKNVLGQKTRTAPGTPAVAPKAPAKATTQAEFDKAWATAAPGESVVGPDGNTYTKPKK